MAFLDELVSGFPVVALPLIREDLALTYAQAGLLFTAGHLASWLLEPFIGLYSDRLCSRRPLALGSLLVLGASFALAATAGSYVPFLLAFVATFPATGAAVGLSQATLVDLAGAGRQRAMARWTLLSAVGDLFSPPVVALLAALPFGWRGLFWLAALLWLGMALLFGATRFPRRAREALPAHEETAAPEMPGCDGRGVPEAEEGPGAARGSLLAAFGAALIHRRLLRWIGVIVAADMLDEVFLGFAALYLAEVMGAGPVATSLALGAQTVGALLGSVVLERTVDRIPPGRRLRFLAGVVLLGLAVLLATRSVWVATFALFITGLGAAAWYPVAKAAAYASLPGRSGMVLASVDVIATLANALLPALVGVVAGGLGVTAGLGVVALAPLAVLGLVRRER